MMPIVDGSYYFTQPAHKLDCKSLLALLQLGINHGVATDSWGGVQHPERLDRLGQRRD
jgi:hypothetical protein